MKCSSEINNLSKGVPDIGIIGQLISNLDIEISSLIGVYTAEDVLNNIFSNLYWKVILEEQCVIVPRGTKYERALF